MTAVLYQAISNNNYKKYILKDTNVTTIFAENAERNENIQHITVACRALAQDIYTHLHNQVANIVYQALGIKCRLSRGPPMPCYNYEPQSVLENSS
jgi:long-subunit acyl-CoA synthetase (AMP-forming)